MTRPENAKPTAAFGAAMGSHKSVSGALPPADHHFRPKDTMPTTTS
jgi:hypothetical protein